LIFRDCVSGRQRGRPSGCPCFMRPAKEPPLPPSIVNHRCRINRCGARRSSSDNLFHRLPSAVAQRLHVKQPVRRSPRLSVSIRGPLHWLQQAFFSSSVILRSLWRAPQRLLPASHARLVFCLIAYLPGFRRPVLDVKVCLRGVASRGDGMPSSQYYRRQADLCVRMALSADAYEERVRLLDSANEYRDRAAQAENVGSAPMPRRWDLREGEE